MIGPDHDTQISLAETDLALVQLSRADHGKHPSTVWYCNIARTKVGKGPRRSPDTAQAVELSEYIEVLGVCTGTLDTMESTRHNKVPGHTLESISPLSRYQQFKHGSQSYAFLPSAKEITIFMASFQSILGPEAVSLSSMALSPPFG